MQSVRWGLLSTAKINRRLIPAIRASARGELVAVASRDKRSAEAYARQWEIGAAFSSYDAMLASDHVDAVYIGLPNHLHAAWTIRALQQGKHVLCEKPLALSVEEVDEMTAASRESGRVLAEAFMYRHHPQTKIAGEWVKDGRLGEVTLIRSVFNYMLRGRDNIRLVPEYGGGSLWDVGVYPVSISQFLMGAPPAAVSGTQSLGRTGVDLTFAGVLQYAGGSLAEIASSFRSPFFTFAEVLGTEGRLILTRPFTQVEQSQLLFYPEEGAPVEIEVPQKELYLGEVEDMHAAILDGAPTYVSLQESRDHIRTTTALYRAAEEQRVIQLA